MSTLSDAIRRLEEICRSTISCSPPVVSCDALITLILSIISSGLYPGLSAWSIFKLLQRLDAQHITSHPVGRRLRFASKTVSMISSFADRNDAAKARAFVKCALNTGHLTGIVELLSCTGTIGLTFPTETCGVESVLHVHDVWNYLLSGGSDNSPVDGIPTIGRLLQPFINDGVNVLRSLPGDPLSVSFARFISTLSLVGGPPLSNLLDMKGSPAHASIFGIDINGFADEDAPQIEQVLPSELCFELTKDDTTITVESCAPVAEEVASPVSRKKIIKKVIVKRRVNKVDAGHTTEVSEIEQSGLPEVPQVVIGPSNSDAQRGSGDEEGIDIYTGCAIENSEAFLSLQSRLRMLVLSSGDCLEDATLPCYEIASGELFENPIEGLSHSWLNSIAHSLAVVPPALRLALEAKIDNLSERLV